MHIMILMVLLLAVFGAGYAVRGWVHRELAVGREELASWGARIENALRKGESDLRGDVSKILSEIRAKLPK